MLVLPDKVKVTLDNLKKEYKFFVSLKKINNRYYLYRQTTAWNKEKKKLKVISTYLGRILDNGAFIKKEITKEDELENAKAIILARGGKVIFPQTDKLENLSLSDVDPIEKKIITTLSMNSRSASGLIEMQTGMKRSTIYTKIKQLEKKYGIFYTTEINIHKFGYFRFLVMAKFIDKKPSPEEIFNAVQNEPKIQLVTILNGRYDLLMYVLAESNEAIADLVIKIRKTSLSKYPTEWYIDSFAEGFNSVKVRDEFIDELKGKFNTKEYLVLKELNKNSVLPFTEIDRICNFDKGRSQYAYYRLFQEKKIIRTTIFMSKPPVKYIGIIFLYLIDYQKFISNRMKILQNIMSDTPSILNQYLLTGDIGIPKGIILFLPILKEGDLEDAKSKIDKLNLGARIETSIITNIILGQFLYRKLDVNYSRQYEVLVEQYHLPTVKRIDYKNMNKEASEDTKLELELD